MFPLTNRLLTISLTANSYCYRREIEDEEDLEMSIKKFLKSKKLLQELKVAETPRILKKKGLEKLVFDFLLYMGVAQCYLGRYDAGLKLILQSKSEAEKWSE